MTSRARNGLAVLLWVGLAAGCGGNSSGESGKDSGLTAASTDGAISTDGAVAVDGSATTCSGFVTLAGGYVTSGALHGYAWLSKDTYPATTMSPADFSALTAGSPLCVSGSVAHSLNWDAWTELGISTNQAPGGATSGTYVPASSGISINLSNPGGSQLRVMLIGPNGASDPNDNWCAPIVASGGFIPWSQFNTKCADNSGTPYAGQALQSIAVMVPDNNTTATPFNFCVHCLAESGAPSGTGGTSGSGGTGGTDGGMSTGGTGGTLGTDGAVGTDGSTVTGDPFAGSTGTVANVTSASSTNTALYTLTGTAAAGVTTVHVEHDGASADLVPSGGVFGTELTLHPGANSIVLTATDATGTLLPMYVTVVFQTGLPSSADLIAAALAAGSISAEQALEYQLFAAFGDARLPPAFAGDNSMVFPQAAIDAAWEAAPTLSDAAKGIIGPFFAPDFYVGSGGQHSTPATAPATGQQPEMSSSALTLICNPLISTDCVVSENWAYVDSTHCRIWYEKTRPQQIIKGKTFNGNTDLSSALSVGYAIDGAPGPNAWSTLSAIMGTTPMSDSYVKAYNGGDGRLDILLVDMAEGWGVTTPNAGPLGINKVTPVFIRLNRNLDYQYLLGSAVHEFMHAIQFAMPLKGSAPKSYFTFMEGTAVWATNRVLPTNQTEHSYNYGYFPATDRKLTSVKDPNKDPFPYGSWIFFYYLSQRYGDAIIADLWNGAAGSTDQLAILKNAVAARGKDADSKDLAKVWQDFGAKLWNQQPDGYFFKADKVTDQPKAAVEGQMALSASGFGSDEFDVAIPAFSTRYWNMTFDDANIRTLLFLNGMNFQLDTEHSNGDFKVGNGIGDESFSTTPFTCPAVLPPPDPAKVAKARIGAIPKRGTEWKTPEDWTAAFPKGFNITCRDDADIKNKLNQLIVVASYADETATAPFQCPMDNPSLSWTSSPCARATGTASLEVQETGFFSAHTYTLDGEGLTWTRAEDLVSPSSKADQPWVSTDGYWVCGHTLDLSGGTIQLTANGTDAFGCTEKVDATQNATTGLGESRISLFDFARAPTPRFYWFEGFGFGPDHQEPDFIGTETCSTSDPPNTPTPTAELPDRFRLASPWLGLQSDFPIPQSGILSGIGAGVQLCCGALTPYGPCDGSWTISPMP